MKKLIQSVLLVGAVILAMCSVAQADDSGWTISAGPEYSHNIKLSLSQPGHFFNNPPHPLGLGSEGEVFENGIHQNPAPGSFGAQERDSSFGASIWASRTWKITDENWRGGFVLGGSWHPIDAKGSFDSISGKDVIHRVCDCTDVSDWYGRVNSSFEGNLFSAYVGPRLDYTAALNQSQTVFLTVFGQGGASFNWLVGSGDSNESIYSSVNSTPATLSGNAQSHYSGSDFNVGAFAMVGARIGGRHLGVEAAYRWDFRSDLRIRELNAATRGGTIFLGLSLWF